MIGDSEGSPIMNHVGFKFKNTESGLYMGGMISDLNLHGSNIFQELNVIRFKSVSVLETFG